MRVLLRIYPMIANILVFLCLRSCFPSNLIEAAITQVSILISSNNTTTHVSLNRKNLRCKHQHKCSFRVSNFTVFSASPGTERGVERVERGV